MNLKRYALFVLMALLGTAAAQLEPPQNWFGVGLGMTMLDVQVGRYDLLGSHFHGRILGGFAFGGGALVSADALWTSGSRSGFYLGTGVGGLADLPLSVVTFGGHVIVGGDIPLSANDGLLLESSLGFYPFTVVYTRDPREMFIPIFARFELGYRRSF